MCTNKIICTNKFLIGKLRVVHVSNIANEVIKTISNLLTHTKDKKRKTNDFHPLRSFFAYKNHSLCCFL